VKLAIKNSDLFKLFLSADVDVDKPGPGNEKDSVVDKDIGVGGANSNADDAQSVSSLGSGWHAVPRSAAVAASVVAGLDAAAEKAEAYRIVDFDGRESELKGGQFFDVYVFVVFMIGMSIGIFMKCLHRCATDGEYLSDLMLMRFEPRYWMSSAAQIVKNAFVGVRDMMYNGLVIWNESMCVYILVVCMLYFLGCTQAALVEEV